MDDASAERAAAMKAAETIASGAAAFAQGITILRKVGVPGKTIRKMFEDVLHRTEIGLPFPPVDALLLELGYEPTPKKRDEDLLRKSAKERNKILAARRKTARSDFRKASRAFDELAAIDPDTAERVRFRFMEVMAEALRAVIKSQVEPDELGADPPPDPVESDPTA